MSISPLVASPLFSPRPAMIGRAAIRALYAEIALYPKPGLVSPKDSGAHRDMDFSTFLRSLFALRAYFPAIAQAGAEGLPFAALQVLGLAAEARMLRATGGINTHRGAIFSLGLISAAAAALHSGASACAIGEYISKAWGEAILGAAPKVAASHGLKAARSHGARGAREEAAAGFPLLMRDILPHYRAVLARTGDEDAAAVETLFRLILLLDDTNLLHRGGAQGLAFARAEAERFLEAGGAEAPDWFSQAQAIHLRFVARNLSPGGAADMLAATFLLHALAGEGA